MTYTNKYKKQPQQDVPFLTQAKAELLAVIDEHLPEDEFDDAFIRTVKRDTWQVAERLLKVSHTNGRESAHKAGD